MPESTCLQEVDTHSRRKGRTRGHSQPSLSGPFREVQGEVAGVTLGSAGSPVIADVHEMLPLPKFHQVSSLPCRPCSRGDNTSNNTVHYFPFPK